MATKPPNIAVRGIRASMPSGFLLGRLDKGNGPTQLISFRSLQTFIAGLASAIKNIVGGTGITVTNGDGISGDPTITLADTAVTPGSYGDATHVGAFTVDQQGRLTAASSVLISASGGGGGSMLPLVSGDLPGPSLIADASGQCIGVPL